MAINNNSANYEEMAKVGSQLTSDAASLLEELNKIETATSTLAEVWAGSDATSYVNAIKDQLVNMKSLQDIINSAGSDMSTIAKTYSDFVSNHQVSGY